MKKLKSLSDSYIDNICGKNYPFGKNIKDFVDKIPDIELMLETEEEKIALTLTCKNNHSICNGHLVIFNEKKNIFIMRFINLKNENNFRINVSVKKNENLPIVIYFITEKFIGFDKTFSIDKNFILTEKNIDDERICEDEEDVSVVKNEEENKNLCKTEELDSQQLKLLDEVIAEELKTDPKIMDKKIKNQKKDKEKNTPFHINKGNNPKNNQNSKNLNVEKKQNSLNYYFEKRKTSFVINSNQVNEDHNDKSTENNKINEEINKTLTFNNFNLFIDNLVFDDDIKERRQKSPRNKINNSIIQKTEKKNINYDEKIEKNEINLLRNSEESTMSDLRKNSRNGGRNEKLTDFYSFFADIF